MPHIDTLFHKMIELGASDLHMTSECVPMFRLHGEMTPVEGQEAIPAAQMEQILLEIAPDQNQKQFLGEWDTDFAYEIEGLARFRCNLFMDRKGPGAVFRQIPSKVLTAEQLNLPKAVLDLCFLSKGLVVVTGPTGSGKSTTLAAMIDHINKSRRDHIITIEDPIEFVHEDQRCRINQREVHRHTGSFKRALRAALREDPDIVLVGEMRDLETIEIAIETAETGHLVFGTLHTNTAASTVDRIIDQFPADRQSQIRTMLSSSLKGVVAQTLCKKQPKGRIAALEILIVNSAIAANVREGKTHQIPSAMQIGGKLGMKLLNDSLLDLVKNGTVDAAEAYIKAVNKDDMMAKFNENGIKVDLQAGEAAHAKAAPKPAAPAAPAPALHAPAAAAPATPQPKPALPQQQAYRPAAMPSAQPAQPAPAAAPKPGFSDPFDAFRKKA
ncbi:MAG: type IV pilus twitching motility protein PilT [Planctomycetota bacterium]|nr:MAG: type IV pilus twitching motility protein PilT [Planctomycetota bacterium]